MFHSTAEIKCYIGASYGFGDKGGIMSVCFNLIEAPEMVQLWSGSFENESQRVWMTEIWKQKLYMIAWRGMEELTIEVVNDETQGE